MKKVLHCLAGVVVAAGIATGPVLGSEAAHLNARDIDFSFEGIFGTFDRAQLQRGYQVYKEVCSACHAMRLMRFRNLGEPGGPEFSEAEVKAIAAGHTVTDGPNQDGEMYERVGEPKDPFPKPFANEAAARASNNGAYPLDLSLITKSRTGWSGTIFTAYTTHLWKGSGGAEYIYSLLTGYQPAPNGEEREGLYHNPYFSAQWIAMPPPLSEDGVTYGDETKATVDQQARDVAAFLMWASEPKMEERKRMGFMVLIYMAVLTVLLYLVKKMIWSRVDH